MFLPFESPFTFRISTDALSFFVVKLRFEFRRETPRRMGALRASMPERGRNPFHAQIACEDEVNNQPRGWSVATNLACQARWKLHPPLQSGPGQSHLQFSRPQTCS
jgi:hypothetical protein